MHNHNSLQILSRLVLSKILASGVVKYLKPQQVESLNSAFLCETLESLDFDLKASVPPFDRHTYYANIVDLSIKWVAGSEQVDPDGNAWQPYDLAIKANVGSCYGVDVDNLLTRADCVNHVVDLIKDLKEIVPTTFMVMTLDTNQKLERDRRLKYEADCRHLAYLFDGSHRSVRSGLRLNGKSRAFRGSIVEGLNITPGTFDVKINEGPRTNPARRSKRYQIVIPSDLSRYGTIRRVG